MLKQHHQHHAKELLCLHMLHTSQYAQRIWRIHGGRKLPYSFVKALCDIFPRKHDVLITNASGYHNASDSKSSSPNSRIHDFKASTLDSHAFSNAFSNAPRFKPHLQRRVCPRESQYEGFSCVSCQRDGLATVFGHSTRRCKLHNAILSLHLIQNPTP